MIRLRDSERASLLRLARAAIEQTLAGNDALTRQLERTEITGSLEEPRAVFVSLKRLDPGNGGDVLRGCIGGLEATRPLYRSTIAMAEAAAFQDPRFPPLEARELPSVRIEISALGPLQPIADSGEIVVGTHGVQFTLGKARSVFLPQVAVEQNWTAAQLVRQLALKAGLGDDDWREAELAVFEAELVRDLA
jgi:AmmeMemoRadiSam system protein A